MRAEIISIGTEILLGHIIDTNSAYLSQKLAEIGIDVYHHVTVGDNPPRLTEVIKTALSRSDIVIMSGGLGPTIDDITVPVIKKFADKSPIRWIDNKIGTAPGLIITPSKHQTIIALPGPPRELAPMFEDAVIQYLLGKPHTAVWGISHAKTWRIPHTGVCGYTLKSRTVKIVGLPESVVNGKVKDLLSLKPPTTVGIYAKLGEVDLRIMAKAGSVKEANKAISKIDAKITARLKGYIFGRDDETLEEAVGKSLIKNKKTIAIAESCTGGLISNRITNVSGSSQYFKMGVVTYSNESKINMLGVSGKTLRKYGAVSKETAVEMAKGVMRLAASDIGIGVTGIAGPGGGTKSKPVGLVYAALVKSVKGSKGQRVKEYHLKGSREEIKFQVSQVGLDLIRRNV